MNEAPAPAEDAYGMNSFIRHPAYGEHLDPGLAPPGWLPAYFETVRLPQASASSEPA
jgi:hypothetical protein